MTPNVAAMSGDSGLVQIAMKPSGVRVTTDARHGDPVTELVAAACEPGAGLIAMTTHGRSGFGRILFGSVAEAVLRQAKVPVLMIRLTEP